MTGDAVPAAKGRRRPEVVRESFILRSDGIGHRVVRGVSYTFLGTILRTVITLASVAMLARLLQPADFGYVAMATVVTELTMLFSTFGLTNILIQRRVAARLQYDTVFWTSTAIGVLAAIAVFGLSFVVGWFFGDDRIGPLLRVLCLTFVFGGLTAVHEAVIARLMNFRAEFWIQMVYAISRAATGIGFAWLGYGAWSLVYAAVAASVVSLVAYCVFVPYVPRLRFSAAYVKANWATSGGYLGRGILYYLDTNLDLVLIGRFLGAVSLGYYQNARSLTDEVRSRIAIPLQRVLFPAFSALQADHARLRESVIRSGRMLAAVVIPVGIGASAIAPELVPVLYGDKWVAMVPIVTMLGLSTAVRGSVAVAAPIFNATDRVGLALAYGIVGTFLAAAAVAAGLRFGIDVVSAAVAVASLYSVIVFRAGIGLIGLGWRVVGSVLVPPLLAALVMWVAVALSRMYMTGAIGGAGIRMVAHILLGAAVYGIVLHMASREYLREFLALGRKLMRR